jgi:hypothetical protein
MDPDDPVIQRIRDARHQLQAECGNDIHKTLLWAMEEQKKCADRLVCSDNTKTRAVPRKAKNQQPL